MKWFLALFITTAISLVLIVTLPNDPPKTSCWSTEDARLPSRIATARSIGAVDQVVAYESWGPGRLLSGRKFLLPREGTLRVTGWAFPLDGSAKSNPRIVLRLGSKTFEGFYGLDRPDVATALRDPAARTSGYCLQVGLRPEFSRTEMELFLVFTNGERTRIYDAKIGAHR